MNGFEFPPPVKISMPKAPTLLTASDADRAEYERQKDEAKQAVTLAVMTRSIAILKRYGDRYGEEGLQVALEVSLDIAPAYEIVGPDESVGDRRTVPDWGAMRLFYLWLDAQYVIDRENCSERQAIAKLAARNFEEYMGGGSAIGRRGRSYGKADLKKLERLRKSDARGDSEVEQAIRREKRPIDSLWSAYMKAKKSPMVAFVERTFADPRLGRERALNILYDTLGRTKTRAELLEREGKGKM